MYRSQDPNHNEMLTEGMHQLENRPLGRSKYKVKPEQPKASRVRRGVKGRKGDGGRKVVNDF